MNEQIRNEIVHLSLRGQSQREIAKQLHVSRNTIKAVLDDLQQAREGNGARVVHSGRAVAKRPSLLDPYETELKELLVRYPEIPVVQVQQRLQSMGCDASYTILRQRVKLIRQAVSRGDFAPVNAPGASARVSYREVEVNWTSRGRCRTNLFAFQLTYSRHVYLHFVPRKDLASTIHEHVCAFEHFCGAAASIEYHNVPVTQRNPATGDRVFASTFLKFASHYGFRPTRRHDGAADDEGLIHRLQADVLNDQRYRSLDHANDVLLCWISNEARSTTGSESRSSERRLQETAHLIPLPSNPWCG